MVLPLRIPNRLDVYTGYKIWINEGLRQREPGLRFQVPGIGVVFQVTSSGLESLTLGALQVSDLPLTFTKVGL